MYKTQKELANELGISRTTLYRKLRKLNIYIGHSMIPDKLFEELKSKINEYDLSIIKTNETSDLKNETN